MTGPLFALITAFAYASNTILVRRAVVKIPDANAGILISVPMAVPLFFLILVFTGQTWRILSFSWQAYIWLSLAGILHFVVGRSLYYECVQLVGANIAGILRRTNILVAVIFGITVLKEPLSWQLAMGVLLIITGISLAGFSPQTFQQANGGFSKIPVRAFALGFGCGLSWGISPIFVKLGLQASGSPIAGGFISFSAATVILFVSLLNRRKRTALTHITGQVARLFFTAGLLSFTANLARYVALSMAPASVVTPLVSIEPVIVLTLSFIFNRRLEIFSKQVIIGTLTVVIGTIILV
jgi:drug/metabolite transporter (DMT)-like permease